MHDINIIPLVDIMLVLLVIFMITAPFMYSGMSLKLPKTKKVHSLKLSQKQIVLSITDDKKFYIGKQQYKREEIVSKVKELLKRYRNKGVFIRADHKLPYGHVAKIMSELKIRGISQISLVTEIVKK